MLEGVFTAIITPFTGNDEIDEEGLKKNIEYTIEGGVDGIVPCGSTGESATLSIEEHKRVIEICVEASSVPVIAGTGSNNTKEALELTIHAADVGADGAMLITPYYNKPNKKGLISHFKKVAESVDIPIVLYNIPSRTGLNIPPEIIAQLAEVDNIVGVKEASGNLNQVSKIIELTKDMNFEVTSGDDSLTLPIMALGGVGVISVSANIVPKKMKELVDAVEKDIREARRIHYELSPLFDALFLETNPIPVKKAAELCGLAAGHVRSPLGPMSQENEEKLKKVLVEMELI
ncbi:MAG: 4-hydroxy-tetrahydrodipicolinate synthase [Candidatus Syntropharchaeia archaeon]